MRWDEKKYKEKIKQDKKDKKRREIQIEKIRREKRVREENETRREQKGREKTKQKKGEKMIREGRRIGTGKKRKTKQGNWEGIRPHKKRKATLNTFHIKVTIHEHD